MAQGTAWDKDEVIIILEPFFKLGCNVARACGYAGIARTTVQTWIDNDEELRLKIEAWQNEPNAKARQNWSAKIQMGDYDASVAWLIRKEKDDFSERKEITGAEGKEFMPDSEQKEKVDNAIATIIPNESDQDNNQ